MQHLRGGWSIWPLLTYLFWGLRHPFLSIYPAFFTAGIRKGFFLISHGLVVVWYSRRMKCYRLWSRAKAPSEHWVGSSQRTFSWLWPCQSNINEINLKNFLDKMNLLILCVRCLKGRNTWGMEAIRLHPRSLTKSPLKKSWDWKMILPFWGLAEFQGQTRC